MYFEKNCHESTGWGAEYSNLAMALNALERSRADQRLITSYKCPCNDCKGGGRPILRRNIELHLRRNGRDPTLTHCMLVSSSINKTIALRLSVHKVLEVCPVFDHFLKE